MSNSFVEPPVITVGLDLSDRFASVCILDELGDVIEEGKVRSTPEAFTRRFGGLEPCRMVLEVGTHSPWISKLLLSFGHEVIVANPRKVQLIAASIQKSDRSDAETLARLGRADPKLLSPVIHRSLDQDADLEVIQARQALIVARTLLINHTRAAVKSPGAAWPPATLRASTGRSPRPSRPLFCRRLNLCLKSSASSPRESRTWISALRS